MFSKTNSNSKKKKKSVKASATPQAANAAKKPALRPQAAPSILGRDITIIGEIKTDGDVQIDGRHDGNIIASTLTVGEQGVINGDVKANAVYVRGQVVGKINASLVELAETANVQADITQDKLTIANGAFFDGKSTRRKSTSASASLVAPQPKAVKSA